MRELDWQDTQAPDHVQQARMFHIVTTKFDTLTDNEDDEYFFDPAIGVMYVRSGRQWQSSIQTFPHGEVRNA